MTTVHVGGGSPQPPAYGPGLRTPAGERRLAELAGTRKRLNGCAAAAYAALYANVDVITAYPIRPYTAIMMNLAQFIADGILDAEYITADGEHAQLSAAFGAGSCGARAYTGSSGVGVTYAYEMYSIISGARIPIQMTIADRTLDPPGDFGSEHTDALCTRDMGWLMGWAATPQEVFDKTLHRLRHRRGPPGAAAADGGAGRLLRLAHLRRGGDARRRRRWTRSCRPTSCRSRSTPGSRCPTARRSTRPRARRCSWSGPGPWRTRSRSSARRPTSSRGSSAGSTRTSWRSTGSTTRRSRS